MPRGFESLADLVDLAHMGASSVGHDIGGGLAGIEELVRTRNAAKAAAAVRKIQERSYRGSPGGQALAGSLPALADAFNPTHLLPREAQAELGSAGQRFGEMWDRVSAGAPAPAAALAGVAGPGGEERSALERALEHIPGPRLHPQGPVTRESLERAHLGRDDPYWGITTDPETDASQFTRSGYSGLQCTGYACELRNKLGAGRVKVLGFFGEDNPTSEIGRQAGGHDFAMVDDRYIVDPWLEQGFSQPLGEGLPSGRGVFDTHDPKDQAAI